MRDHYEDIITSLTNERDELADEVEYLRDELFKEIHRRKKAVDYLKMHIRILRSKLDDT